MTWVFVLFVADKPVGCRLANDSFDFDDRCYLERPPSFSQMGLGLRLLCGKLLTVSPVDVVDAGDAADAVCRMYQLSLHSGTEEREKRTMSDQFHSARDQTKATHTRHPDRSDLIAINVDHHKSWHAENHPPCDRLLRTRMDVSQLEWSIVSHP